MPTIRNRIANAIAPTVRALLASLIFAGPVYGVSEMRLGTDSHFSSGAGIVILAALQRAGD